ncbi:MAG: hypothetical protein DRO23_08480, partial [Thermoprotei archaeon]
MEAKTLVSKLVSNIISWKIRSSTELVEEILNTLGCIIKKSKDLNSLVLDVIYTVNEVIKVRPTAAMLINCSRDILLELHNVINSKPKLPEAKEALLNKIRKIKGRMMNNIERIATIGANRIVPGDVIMTSAYSKTVMKIFEKALE